MKILVTGVAGFIGYYVSLELLKKNYQIVGIDNLNNYYDISLKKDRLSQLKQFSNFQFNQIDISNHKRISQLFKYHKFNKILHLAAQAGVQYSIVNPDSYVNSNLVGFFNILNNSIKHNISHLIYASSSSVYGLNKSYPFKESLNCSSPLSFYAATKISNEAMAHSYSNIYGIETTGLRFFTVYGPYGRPDMSPFIFADAIINNKKIKIYNKGKLKRDFTYIDDAVNATLLILMGNKRKSKVKSKIYNIGSNAPISILRFINLFEKFLNKSGKLIFKPLLKGDISETFSDISAIYKDYGYVPKISVSKGVEKFINWYKDYYQ